MTRRSTVDWVLQRAAAAEPRVEVRGGVKVTGLLAVAGPVAIPARGARFPHGRRMSPASGPTGATCPPTW